MKAAVLELTESKEKRFFGFFWASILPILFSLTWLIKNTQLPSSDPANFLGTAVDIYHHFINQGFWDGIYSCYWTRGWRPIFFPVMLLPFLFFVKGNLLFAYSLFALFSIILTTIYVYLLFRLDLKFFQAIIATNLIGLLPMLQVQVLNFYAESILFPCIVGCIYHLIKSNYLRDVRHSIFFSLLFSLAILIRPIETSMLMIFVLSYFIGRGWYQGIFRFEQIVFLIAACLFGMLTFISLVMLNALNQPNFSTNEFHIIGLVFKVVALATGLLIFILNNIFYIRSNVQAHASYLLPAFIMILIITLAWFLPFGFETFQWIYDTSLGDVAMSTTRLIHSQMQIWLELNTQVQAEGRVVVLTSLALAVISFCISIRKNKLFASIPQQAIYLLLITPLPWLEVLFTVQDIHRKLSVAFPALIMALQIIILHKRKFQFVSTGIVSLLVAAQFMLLWLATFVYTSVNEHLNNMIGYYVQAPVLIKPNPHEFIRDFLTEQAKKNKLNYIILEVNPYTSDPVDPFLLSTVVQAANKNYVVGYHFFNTFSEDNPHSLLQKSDAIFLSDNVNRMQVSKNSAKEYLSRFENETSPVMKTMYEFLYYYSSNRLGELGWKVGPCTIIKSSCLANPIELKIRKDDCLGCLLLPINK